MFGVGISSLSYSFNHFSFPVHHLLRTPHGDAFEAGGSIPLGRLEEGEAVPLSPNARTQKNRGIVEDTRNICSLILGPVFVQSFVLTFLGEWGDRSQIATIALGAADNVYLVTLGTILGHTCCTLLSWEGGMYRAKYQSGMWPWEVQPSSSYSASSISTTRLLPLQKNS